MSSPAGRVFDIQRFSIHDGPGIRTTVFLKGCPLRCLWCHNPEGIDPGPEVSFAPEKCIGCGECVRACSNEAHRFAPDHIYQRERCEACGRCTETCYTHALEWVGRLVTVEEVMCEVLQDKVFYANSGGGLSISGGEPLAQCEFTRALLETARAEGLHCCLETSGFASWQRIEPLVPLVDLFLFDVKETDAGRHAQFTGLANDLILSNLRALDRAGGRIQLQCPIIPGYNNREDHLAAVATLALSLQNGAGVQLLPYHPLGRSKLRRFAIHPAVTLPNVPMPQSEVARWAGQLRDLGVRVLNHA